MLVCCRQKSLFFLFFMILCLKTGFFEQLSVDAWECHPGTVLRRTLDKTDIQVAYHVSSVDPVCGVCFLSFLS